MCTFTNDCQNLLEGAGCGGIHCNPCTWEMELAGKKVKADLIYKVILRPKAPISNNPWKKIHNTSGSFWTFLRP